MKEYELGDLNKDSGNKLQPPPQLINSQIAVLTQRIRQTTRNIVAADQSRRHTRKTKGLNPDAPRDPAMPKEPPKNQKEANDRNADQKAQQIQNMDEHRIPLDQLCFRFGTNLQTGLTSEMALKRNAEQGDNKLPQKKKEPGWLRFLRQITNWFAIMLWIGSILCIVIYIVQPTGNLPNLYLAFVLMFVVLLTGGITYTQGAKSAALMQTFANLLPSQSKVLRDGKLTQTAAQKLVRGDIVQVKSGEKVPADIRIISSNEMRVDNSALTGEVEPLLRSPECSHPNEPLQTKNLAFFGTLCKEGIGRGVVIGIAEKTFMGQIADLAASGGTQKTPLRIQLDRFVLIITVIAVTLGVVFFILALVVVHYSALQCIIFGIGILVANVPEGLLACITISLSITAKKLFQKQVLVKNLQAVETLGSTSCICSDKTGTLTQNKMTVQNLWYDNEVRKGVSKQLKGQEFQYQYQVDDPSFKILHHTAMICSTARFDISEQQSRAPGFKYSEAPVIGDASETAFVKFFQPIEDIQKTRQKYPFGKCKDNSPSTMPFNSTNKYALSIVQQQGPDHHYVSYIKGAPQKVWKYCGRILHQGKYKTIGPQERKEFEQQNLRFGKNGERVLGFAMLPLNKEVYHEGYPFVTSTPANFNFPLENYIFVGLISLIDPPKESVPFAIKKCQSAGIKVIMVTGDQPPTAAAIAKQIGIITKKTSQDFKQEGYTATQALKKANAIVINGQTLTRAFQEGQEQGDIILTEWCKKPQIVFARTSPAQKLQIVKACQNLGNVVGVTGDGVNDSPAIKQGDIGISMGISGSDVTKDAADMILLNDDFASIVDGVQEGRKIFDNLKKTIVYLLTSNMTQIWPFIALVILQIPLPLSNIFMLCICVGTDIYPALSLAYEEAQVDIMTRRPRKPTEHLVTARLLTHAYGQMGQIATAGGFFTYFVVMQLYGFPPSILFGLVSTPAAIPQPNGDQGTSGYDYDYNTKYTYDQTANNLGLPVLLLPCSPQYLVTGFPNWIATTNSALDVRAIYSKCDSQNNYTPLFTWPTDVLDTFSSISGNNVKFTTQSIFFAQSAYFTTVVMVQWSNVFACKSRKVSLIYSGFNKHMFLGVLTETIVFIFLLYVPGVNGVFGGRPLNFFILGLPGLGFSMFLLIWQESRKFLINLDSNHGKPNWFNRNLLW